jgi:hypothetical protein
VEVHLRKGKVQVQIGEMFAPCSTLVGGMDGDVVLVEEDLLARSERQRQAQCNLGRFETVCDRAWDGWKRGRGEERSSDAFIGYERRRTLRVSSKQQDANSLTSAKKASRNRS